MRRLQKNVNTTGFSIEWPLQLNINPKVVKVFPMISFPQCRSSPIWGGRMVETIAIETSFRINQNSCVFFSNPLVARPVGQKEINNTPAAQAAPDKEWKNLTSKGAWD